MSERLARALGGLLERRTSRRGLFARSAVAGAAFAVAPVRYLLRPDSAWAVVTSADCPPGSRCRDGYSAFCCEIEHGDNRCPHGTYVAGWWKCTDYQGGGLCAGDGARYYLDCNRVPGVPFPGGCQCANGNCSQRCIDCNLFRYGQCNTNVPSITEVVCRLMICQDPATVPGLNCNGTVMVDNATCDHEAGCLEGLAVELPGGAGV
ncbi:MAG TPA: hypothetical protein VG186_11350 [Solirubrobacteraceae bacterium]|jgi:hypothetical protein|nr:hypothetical protein [Solirubrobacteraceae bacterium]